MLNALRTVVKPQLTLTLKFLQWVSWSTVQPPEMFGSIKPSSAAAFPPIDTSRLFAAHSAEQRPVAAVCLKVKRYHSAQVFITQWMKTGGSMHLLHTGSLHNVLHRWFVELWASVSVTATVRRCMFVLWRSGGCSILECVLNSLFYCGQYEASHQASRSTVQRLWCF